MGRSRHHPVARLEPRAGDEQHRLGDELRPDTAFHSRAGHDNNRAYMAESPGTDQTLPADTLPVGMPIGRDWQSNELVRGTSVDRYLILSKLGEGGMGVVYVAYDPELDRRVALKLLLPRTSEGALATGRARLLREAQALAKLAHPNVVTIYDVGMYGDGVWIAMELVVGVTLSTWVSDRVRRWPEVLRVLMDTARGIAAAHRVGLVHRDLKPDNVRTAACVSWTSAWPTADCWSSPSLSTGGSWTARLDPSSQRWPCV